MYTYIKTFILLILILFVYSEFHGKKDCKSSEGLNKNISNICIKVDWIILF